MIKTNSFFKMDWCIHIHISCTVGIDKV
jgi:hypothetical protein